MCYTVPILFLFTRMVTDYHGFFLYVPNYRIIEFFFFTRNVTEFTRNILVTNYRIIEFLFTRSSTENHGFIFLS